MMITIVENLEAGITKRNRKFNMKIEIWSDIMCPFCYIGKRKFEHALEQFEHKSKIQVEWRSFQLDPDRQYVPGKSIHDVLAEKKRWSADQAKQMNEHVAKMA